MLDEAYDFRHYSYRLSINFTWPHAVAGLRRDICKPVACGGSPRCAIWREKFAVEKLRLLSPEQLKTLGIEPEMLD